MKQFTLGLLILAVGVRLDAGEREEAYFRDKCLPLTRDFIRRNHLPLSPDFATNKISHWRVHFEKPSGVYLSRMMLEKRYAFLFIGNEAANGLNTFQDNGGPYRPSLLNPENEPKMRLLAAQTNLLNHATALALVRQYFQLQGHDEKNFHPVRFKQIVWAWAVPSRRITLPFYEAEWARKDVKLPIEANESIYPSVTVIVSGLESNLVVYSKILLPEVFGQDWEIKRPENGRNNGPPVP